MMTVGTPAKVEFIGMQAPAASVVQEEDAGEGELMDFDMI